MSIIKHKEVTLDTVNARIIDVVVSYVPRICDGMYETEIKGFKHLQSLSDTVLCNLLSTMLNNERPYSRNEIDRLIKFVAPNVHASTVIPVLEDNMVIENDGTGYVITQRLKNYRTDQHVEMQDNAPMVNTPLREVAEWTSLEDGIHSDARMKLVTKSRGTQVSETAMGAVNKLQAVKFVVSPTVVNIVEEYVTIINQMLLTETDTDEHDKLRNAASTAKYLKALHARGGDFSFGVTMDWRTRMYYRCAGAQPQGSNLEKAAFQFARSMPMSDKALEGMRIHVANELGRDKLSYNGRIKFMRKEGAKIAFEVAANPTIATITKYVKLDKCFSALVGCVEYVRVLREYLANDRSWDGIESNLVCHQDGTCNGIQHASALLQDRATATAVNCVASTQNDAPEDIYGLVAKTAAESLSHRPDLAQLLNRDVCKKPVMVMGYGASEGTVLGGVAEKMPLGMPIEDVELVQNAVLKAIAVHAAAVVKMTEAINAAVTKWFNEDIKKQAIAWRTPDGCIIKQAYKDNSAKVVIPSGYIFTLSKHKPHIDVEKMARALSPNLIHSLDATHLRGVVLDSDHDIVAVHDSIGSHPATFLKTARTIREGFVRIHTSNPLRTLSKWNGGIELERTGDYNVKEAIESTYIFS